MQVGTPASFSHRQPSRFHSFLNVRDDLLLVHKMLGISIHAISQEPSCKMRPVSEDANSLGMTGLESDTKLVLDLCAFAGKKPSRVALELGMAATTLTRPAGGKAKTRLGRQTLNTLRAAYPDWPGWNTAIDVPEANAIPFQMEGASIERMREDLAIYGSAMGADRIVDGEAIEQTTLNKAEIVGYAKRPVILNGKSDAYGLYVAGSSMYPAHPDGGIVLVDPKRPARIGDDVVVYLRPKIDEDDDGSAARAVLVKRLVRRTASYLELEQFTPPKVFRISSTEIVYDHRVIPWSELLS